MLPQGLADLIGKKTPDAVSLERVARNFIAVAAQYRNPQPIAARQVRILADINDLDGDTLVEQRRELVKQQFAEVALRPAIERQSDQRFLPEACEFASA